MARKPDYGRGHPAFLEYISFIVNHPNYAGMPDVYLDNGDIQWEAPSNRPAGKFQDTHNRRRDWWRRKAREIGIDPDSPHWISRTAKEIHPTNKKPCKACGNSIDIRYAYPNHHLFRRIKKLAYFDESFELGELEHITKLVSRMVASFGDKVFGDLPGLLKAKGATTPSLPPTLDVWLEWIDKSYIPCEPSILSPGVMSNPPDRLDGFHSFNLCCRQTADPGRSKENLQSYTTDRRVFEYWVDGDWVAADRLMGLVRSLRNIKRETCRNNNHPGPCNSDHIGPISLGFTHRPEFQLLCGKCNSAKNNRMYLSDVIRLREVQAQGESVASWYCRALWDKLNCRVSTEETALRLCKILRDNRHTAMFVLHRIAAEGHLGFLLTLLGLNYADRDPTFVRLRIEKHFTVYDRVDFEQRTTKYAVEQKARRIRVAFSALDQYVEKVRRNAQQVSSERSEQSVQDALTVLRTAPKSIHVLDRTLTEILSEEPPSEERLRRLVAEMPATSDVDAFEIAKSSLVDAMRCVAEDLVLRWDDNRYVREEVDLDE